MMGKGLLITKFASVMAEIGYSPEAGNGATTKAHQPRIGVLIPSCNNQIFVDLLAGIQSVTRVHGYQTLVVNSDDNAQREEEQIATVLALHVKELMTAHTLRAEKYLSAANTPVAEVMGLDASIEQVDLHYRLSRGTTV